MKLGTVCKWIDTPEQINGIGANDDAKRFNTRTTTVSWLNNHTDQAEQRLWELMTHNIQSMYNLVERIAQQPQVMHLLRIGSDILPCYTEPTWSYFWQKPDVIAYMEREFLKVGDLARAHDIRLSFHPGQFVVIVSDKPHIVARSLEELEYHAIMAKFMGYGRTKLDFKINVHLSGRLGADGFVTAWNQMSPELRNCLTLENDEYQANLDALIPLGQYCGLVLDIHHHLIHSGEYIQPSDDRIKHVIDSWQGLKPTIHYSQSQWQYLQPFQDVLPTFEQLTAVYPKGKLRSHSDFYNHMPTNLWALQHLDWAHMMCEAKSKNLGVKQLLNIIQNP